VGTSLYRTSLAVVASALGAAVALPALADIYTWTDERGTTVISDTPPANPKRVSDLQVVARDTDKKSAKRSGAREATPTEQKLLDRIDNLERQVKAQTYSSPPVAAASPPPAVSYSTVPPAPPAYAPAYDPYYYDYSGYYSPSYYYPPSYSYIVPGFVGRGFGRRHHGHFPHRPIAGRGGVVARGRR
jgi:hypothetical protein